MKVFVILILISFHVTQAQDYPRTDFNLEKLADEIFPVQDLDLNYEELYENLAQLLSRPLELNTITHEQLRALFVLKEDEINSLLKYRAEAGPFLSVYELQSVPGWSRATFDRAIPFVTVRDQQSIIDKSLLHRMVTEGEAYILVRTERAIETPQGFKGGDLSKYQGSPEKLYMRYRMSRVNDFSLGFTMEKDPGESFDWSPSMKKYGFDYWSAHLQLVNKGKLKNLVVGDYQAQFGQGLILGSVFGFGKNAETITTVRRSNLGFLPYTSLNENLFFRGAAMTYQLSKNIFIHGLASLNSKDASAGTSTDENPVISSFSSSGLHRTQSEILNRKQITETNLGGVFQFRIQNLDAGLILHQVKFSQPVLSNPRPYNQFAFKGAVNTNVGIYLNYSFANFTFFTEYAQTLQHGNAITAGLLGSLSRKAEVSLLYRNFSLDYYSFTSNAFSESTQPQNEIGFYWGWKYAFSKKFLLAGYTDLFRFPWLRYRGYAPSEGSEWLLRFTYSPSRSVQLFIQAREESKIRNQSSEVGVYRYANGVKRNYWISCDYALTPGLSFKTRVQFSTYDLFSNITRGVVVAQDVSFSIRKWSFSMRYALFDTDDYDNRLYLYEKDVWLAYSFPAYDGAGIRNYILAQYRLSKKVDLWARWARTSYSDRDQIGSGSDRIEGNTKNDIKFQVRIMF